MYNVQTGGTGFSLVYTPLWGEFHQAWRSPTDSTCGTQYSAFSFQAFPFGRALLERSHKKDREQGANESRSLFLPCRKRRTWQTM